MRKLILVMTVVVVAALTSGCVMYWDDMYPHHSRRPHHPNPPLKHGKPGPGPVLGPVPGVIIIP